jgi:glutathione S-transferase
MLTLYLSPGSSSMAPHIALHEIGQPFESKLVELGKKEQRTPEYLALNPEGKVPLLVTEGGKRLSEVAAILYYLGRHYPEAQLWPAGDLDAEAQVISWMSFIASTIHPARGRGLEHMREVYGLAERRLGTQSWAIGRYSIADIHLFRLYWRFSKFLELPAGSLPALDAHYARMMERPAVKRTIEAESAIGYQLP